MPSACSVTSLKTHNMLKPRFLSRRPYNPPETAKPATHTTQSLSPDLSFKVPITTIKIYLVWAVTFIMH